MIRLLLSILLLVFLFHGTPDNWDKLNQILDVEYQKYMEKENV